MSDGENETVSSNNSEPIPGSSFVQVGYNLEKEGNSMSSGSTNVVSGEGTVPPLHDDDGKDVVGRGRNVQSDLSPTTTGGGHIDVDADDNGHGGVREGILITSGVQEGEGQELLASLMGNEISVQSLNTYDIQTMEEMMNAATASSKKNRATFHRIIFGISCAFLLICSYLGYALNAAIIREQDLKGKVDRLSRDNERLEFEHTMNGRSNMSPLIEFESCYLKFKASASFGECAEDLTRNAYEWYEWGRDNLYSFGEEIFEQGGDGDGSDGKDDATQGSFANVFDQAFDDLFENISTFFTPEEKFDFDLDLDE